MPLASSSPTEPISPEPPLYVLAAPGSVVTSADPSRRLRLTKLLAASSLLALALKPYAAQLPPAAVSAPANNYVVINNLDTGPGSLRQAVIDANNHPGFDIISFAPQVSGIIPLTSGQLLISTTVSMQGPGPGKLSVSGGHTQRIFYLYSKHVPFTATISGLTLRDGDTLGVGGAMAVWDVDLTLDNVAILSSTARGSGGGLSLGNNITNGLTLRNSLISGNMSTESNGGGLSLYRAQLGVTIQNA